MRSTASFPQLPDPIHLTADEQVRLWTIASTAVKEHVLAGASREGLPPGKHRGEPSLPEPGGLGQRAGVFVTLRRAGDLRGCVGTTEALEPLHKTVQRLACAAASLDRRFSPVQPDEIAEIEVEITVLGSLVRLPGDAGALIAGLRPEEHGVRIRVGDQGGLLLPQVARRFGWGADELLGQVSLKAGLWRDAWKDPRAEIFGFTASSFEWHGPSGERG
jgi:AmmeMemoRadiSam system protein A